MNALMTAATFLGLPLAAVVGAVVSSRPEPARRLTPRGVTFTITED